MTYSLGTSYTEFKALKRNLAAASANRDQLLKPLADKLYDEIDQTRLDRNLDGSAFYNAIHNYSKSTAAGAASVVDGYRNYLVLKLRKFDFGKFGWHSSLNGYNPARSRILSGLDTDSTTDPLPTTKYGLNGDPSVSRDIQWILSRTTDTSLAGNFAGFWMFNNLPAGSVRDISHAALYRAKWLELATDFLFREYDQVRNATYTDAKGITFFVSGAHSANWTTNAGSSLAQGDRVLNLIKALGVFAKNLERTTSITTADEWENITGWNGATLTESDRAKLPSEDLFYLSLSLVHHHPAALLQRYAQVTDPTLTAVPNQRLNGLIALAYIQILFSEFAEVRDVLDPIVGPALARYHAEIINPLDGGMLEQSFNYNIGDATKLYELGVLYASLPTAPVWVTDLVQAGAKFEDVTLRSIADHLGQLFRIGSFTPNQSGFIWNTSNSTDLNSWNNSINRQESRLTDRKEYRSIQCESKRAASSGYYALRSLYGESCDPTMGTDSYMRNGVYVGFVNSRRARGHKSPNSNALSITAFGRKIISSGGTPWYQVSDAPANQLSEYGDYNSYFKEDSSFKNSTIVVNDLSQSLLNRPTQSDPNGSILYVVPTDTIANRWHVGSAIDYVDGTWDGGYGGGEDVNGAALPATNTNTTHKREILFLKPQALVVVSDTLSNSGPTANSYRQIWNFAPYAYAKKTVYDSATKTSVSVDVMPGVGFSSSGFDLDCLGASAGGFKALCTGDTSSNAPNLSMAFFSTEALTLSGYCGYKGTSAKDDTVYCDGSSTQKFNHDASINRYLGWASEGSNGERVPRPDIHIRWNEATQGLSRVVTVIAPSKTSSPRISDLTKLSSNGSVGFALKVDTASGARQGTSVRFLSNSAVAPMSFGAVSVMANSLLWTGTFDTGSGSEVLTTQSGIVTGGTSLNFRTGSVPIPSADFEFQVMNGCVSVRPFGERTSFGSAYCPPTGSPSISYGTTEKWAELAKPFALAVQNTGGPITACDLDAGSPSLPSGLVLQNDCTVFGSPTSVVNPVVSVTVRATGTPTQYSTATLRIGTLRAPYLHYANDLNFNTLGSSANLAPDNTSILQRVTCSANGLPASVTLNASTCTLAFNPTGSAEYSGTATIRATNGVGSYDAAVRVGVFKGTPGAPNYSSSLNFPSALPTKILIKREDTSVSIAPALSGGMTTGCNAVCTDTATNTVIDLRSINLMVDNQCKIVNWPGTKTFATHYEQCIITPENGLGKGPSAAITLVVVGAPSGLTYASSKMMLNSTSTTSITNAATISNGNGIPVNCSSRPSLPAGVTFSTNYCSLNFSPSILLTESAPQSYEITAANPTGSATSTVTIGVYRGLPEAPDYSQYFNFPTTNGTSPTRILIPRLSSSLSIAPAIRGGISTSCAATCIDTFSNTAVELASINLQIDNQCKITNRPGTNTFSTHFEQCTVTPANELGSGPTTTVIFAVAPAPSGLTYASQTMHLDSSSTSSITNAAAITNGNGVPVNCSSSPPLPAGVTFSTSYCSLRFSPSSSLPQSSSRPYTLTASNAAGGTSTTVALGIFKGAPGSASFNNYNNYPVTSPTRALLARAQSVSLTPSTTPGGIITSCDAACTVGGSAIDLATYRLAFDSTSCRLTNTGSIYATNVISCTITPRNPLGSATSTSFSFQVADTPQVTYTGNSSTSPFAFTTGTSSSLSGSLSAPPTGCSITSSNKPAWLAVDVNCKLTGTPTGPLNTTAITVRPSNPATSLTNYKDTVVYIRSN